MANAGRSRFFDSAGVRHKIQNNNVLSVLF
ncbi:hypothetical protein RCH14_000478 [Massilia sp. MP_M2]